MVKNSLSIFSFKLFVLVLPYVIYFGPPSLVLFSGGELLSSRGVERAAKSSLDKKGFLFGPLYSFPVHKLKISTLQNREAVDLLVLGSSRGFPFRAELFQPHLKFFNASGGLAARHVLTFFNQIPEEKYPKHVFWAIDAFDLRKCDHNTSDFDPNFKEPVNSLRLISASAREIWSDLREEKFDISKLWISLFEPFPRGLSAHLSKFPHGFRGDGSYNLAWALSDYPAGTWQRLNVGIQRVKENKFGLKGGARVDPECMRLFDEVIGFLHDHKIKVTGFLTPNPPSIDMEIKKDINSYGYIFDAPGVLSRKFLDHGESFIDGSNPTVYGSSDLESIDSIHMSEKTYTRALKYFVKSNPNTDLGEILLTSSHYERLIVKSYSSLNILPD